jgi:predicted negative regulator of RcsB-dependent stress response
MEIYETEEERLAAAKRWWTENGQSTITGIVIGIALILGWNFWQNYKQDQALQASVQYESLLLAVKEEKTESAEKIAQLIRDQFKGTPYATFSGLALAKIKVGQGQLDEAKSVLQSVVSSADDENLAHVARLNLVRVMLAKGENEQGLQVIADVTAKAMGSFSGSYDELKGDLYVALDRLDEARAAYQSALRSGHKSPLLGFKLDDLTEAAIVTSQP